MKSARAKKTAASAAPARDWANPPALWRDAPFWSWNEALRPARLRRQIRRMKDAGMGGFFMHSRYGLKTPYLSQAWFRCVSACVEEARRLGMKAYLYDEDRWPSGSAGGLVTRAKTEFRSRVLERRAPGVGADTPDLAVFDLVFDKAGRLASYRRAEGGAPQPSALRRREAYGERLDQPSGWYNDGTYLDTPDAEAVEAYLQSTHEPYRARYGRDFGGVIPAIFTDEPNMGWARGDSAVTWTRRLPAEFRARRGYDLLAHLPELFYPLAGGDFSPVRRDFRLTLTELFVANFTRRIADWCGQYRIPLTGHVLEEYNYSSQIRTVGAAMPHYEFMQWPGVDILCDPQPVELSTVKQCTSVCDQLGKERALSELYGGTGWDCSLEQHKFIGDWQAACGINFRCVHLVHYSLAGGAKRDWPPSQLMHCGWDRYYRGVEDYFARLSWMLAQGRPIRDVLVLYPMDSAWGLFTAAQDGQPGDPVMELWKPLHALMYDLLDAQVDYDLGDETILAGHGRVSGRRLHVGRMDYGVVVVPPSITWRSATVDLLERFQRGGGRVVFFGRLPDRVDGRPSPRLRRLIRGGEVCAAEGVTAAVARPGGPRLTLSTKSGARLRIWAMQREWNGGRLLFLQSHDRATGHALTVDMEGRGDVVLWDCASGTRHSLPADSRGGRVRFDLDLPATGSALVTVGVPVRGAKPRPVLRPRGEAVNIGGPYPIALSAPNHLPLTHCRYALGRGRLSEPRHVLAADGEIRKHYALPPRGTGDHQPWYLYALGTVDTAPRDACRMEWTFHVSDMPAALRLAVERPERWGLTVNGRSVQPDGGWWMDEDFRTLDIRPALKRGRNVIAMAFAYRADMELEPMYLVGDFGTRRVDPAAGSRADNFTLTAAPRELAAGSWVGQGLDFYGDGVRYRVEADLPEGACGLRVQLPAVRSTAAVIHSPKRAHPALWPPYEAFIPAEELRVGRNVLYIELFGGRRNILEPGSSGWWDTTGSERYNLSEFGLLGPVAVQALEAGR